MLPFWVYQYVFYMLKGHEEPFFGPGFHERVVEWGVVMVGWLFLMFFYVFF